MSPEEDRTRDTVDSEPMHYQLSYSGPLLFRMKFDVEFKQFKLNTLTQLLYSEIYWLKGNNIDSREISAVLLIA